MKILGKTEDRMIDNLLRAHSRAASSAGPLCGQFDPDLANAYIEHALTAVERAGYESHISACAPCRKATVALARMVEADQPAPARAPEIAPQAGWLEALKAGFSWQARPGWAMAAVAIIAVAIALPILLSQKGERPASDSGDNKASELQSSQAQAGPNASLPPAEGLVARVGQDTQAGAANAGNPRADSEEADRAGQAVEPGQQSPESAAGAAPQSPRSEPPKTEQVEAKGSPSNPSEAERAATGGQIAAQQPPSPPAPAGGELARIDTKDTLRLPDQDKESSHTTIKPGTVGSEAARIEQREKTATITPQDTVAPPPESSQADSRARRGITRGSAARSLRDRNSVESARSRSTPERTVGKKRFRFLDGAWTDKNYRSDKEMPVVTVIRDSDVYKELLAKRSGLKLYFTNFAEGDRVIIVYNGTVYKLVPQGAGD